MTVRRFDAFGIRPNSLETSADSFTFPEFRVEVIDAGIVIAPFRITDARILAPDAVQLTWESQAGVTYHVLSSGSLSPINWTTNATIVATGSSTSHTDAAIAGRAESYYRVSAAR